MSDYIVYMQFIYKTSKINMFGVYYTRYYEEEEKMKIAEGLNVIYTPGHICLYLKKYKSLVTGDVLNVIDGELRGPNPEYTFDMRQATESLKKLAKYDIETVICYHGGVFTNNSNEKIAELANG